MALQCTLSKQGNTALPCRQAYTLLLWTRGQAEGAVCCLAGAQRGTAPLEQTAQAGAQNGLMLPRCHVF